MFRLSTLALLGAEVVGSTTKCGAQDEHSMLQMPVVQNSLAADEDAAECRCPGYFQEQCEAEAAQGCVWSSEGSSNGPWCQCNEPIVGLPVPEPPYLPHPPPPPVVPVTEPPAPVTEPPAPVTEPPAPVTEPPPPEPPTEPATCPSGWVQVGESGADIGGCGLQPCNQRYGTTSEEQCSIACDGMAGCQGFNYAPRNGDRNHESMTVCTLYNSNTPTGTWSGTAGFVQALCTRVTPPAEPNPPVAFISQCGAGRSFAAGDGIGGHEQNIGNADTPELCAAMVREQCPDANGVTLPTGGSGGCYCEFGMTSVNGNANWQSCSFETAEEQQPPVTSLPGCVGGSFLIGDGSGGHETFIGTSESPEHCSAMVHEQCPSANGATLPTSGSGNCYCEFGMTGVNTNSHWQSCNFVVPAAEPEPPVNTLSQCDSGSFLVGDGVGGHETNIGTAVSPERCVAMVREQCPEANGATLPTSGSGGCYCEFGMTGVNSATSWQSCSFVAPPVQAEPPTTIIPQCVGGTFLTGDGAGGHEQHIGSADSPEECAAMVQDQCPSANGATLAAAGSGACYCEFSMSSSNGNTNWQTCQFESSEPVPIAECDGGVFEIGDGTGGNERHIGSATTPEQCVAMVRDLCPGANGATLPVGGSGGCYCEFGMHGRHGTTWQSCSFVTPLLETEPVTNPPQCVGGGYLTGDGTGGTETNIGTADSPEQCAAMVQEQCPDANGATLPTSGSGGCYCEYGMTGVNGNSHWQSCGFVSPQAEPEPVANLSQCTGGGYLAGDGTGGHETQIGTANSPEQCLTMVRDECPDANGATLPTSGSGGCYCEFGMTGVNSATSWQSCRFD